MFFAHPGSAVDKIRFILILQSNIQKDLKLKQHCQICNFRSYTYIYISLPLHK